MNLDLIDYEVSGDAVIDDGGADDGAAVAAETAVAAEPGAAADALPDTPAATEAPAFSLDDPQVQARLAEMTGQQVAQFLQQAFPQQEAEAPEYDPFDPDSVKAYMDWQLEQRMSQYMPAIEQVQNQQLNQWVDRQYDAALDAAPALKDALAADSPLVDKRAILSTASGFNQTLGNDAQAIQEAVGYWNKVITDAKAAGRAEYIASLQGDNGASADPAVRGAAIPVEGRAKTFDDVIRNWETRSAA